ncbi:uncharacterized protein AMSG_09267 [Thecamonas trahens ATCC 50062]|uniref:Uncharacterized protein n=1 Tax=Thecamonas trahens ATCC 50062 TaxID=461836 RepID=A0A0L0DME3_THETB|nr:hypothetical protein AMSG_09267 [Thecamonas trahens ATCC 50062]KNC53186.1 hypothetical protein AMSG_09267 [Thecamonas trahens ATCC 50062]|eukprot:XP_013754658.1 hypothetical protein AMSG_09267 [Thecamonas trahens ATCC 50062]
MGNKTLFQLLIFLRHPYAISTETVASVALPPLTYSANGYRAVTRLGGRSVSWWAVDAVLTAHAPVIVYAAYLYSDDFVVLDELHLPLLHADAPACYAYDALALVPSPACSSPNALRTAAVAAAPPHASPLAWETIHADDGSWRLVCACPNHGAGWYRVRSGHTDDVVVSIAPPALALLSLDPDESVPDDVHLHAYALMATGLVARVELVYRNTPVVVSVPHLAPDGALRVVLHNASTWRNLANAEAALPYARLSAKLALEIPLFNLPLRSHDFVDWCHRPKRPACLPSLAHLAAAAAVPNLASFPDAQLAAAPLEVRAVLLDHAVQFMAELGAAFGPLVLSPRALLAVLVSLAPPNQFSLAYWAWLPAAIPRAQILHTYLFDVLGIGMPNRPASLKVLSLAGGEPVVPRDDSAIAAGDAAWAYPLGESSELADVMPSGVSPFSGASSCALSLDDVVSQAMAVSDLCSPLATLGLVSLDLSHCTDVSGATLAAVVGEVVCGGVLRSLAIAGCVHLSLDELAALLDAASTAELTSLDVSALSPELQATACTTVCRSMTSLQQLALREYTALPPGAAADLGAAFDTVSGFDLNISGSSSLNLLDLGSPVPWGVVRASGTAPIDLADLLDVLSAATVISVSVSGCARALSAPRPAPLTDLDLCSCYHELMSEMEGEVMLDALIPLLTSSLLSLHLPSWAPVDDAFLAALSESATSLAAGAAVAEWMDRAHALASVCLHGLKGDDQGGALAEVLDAVRGFDADRASVGRALESVVLRVGSADDVVLPPDALGGTEVDGLDAVRCVVIRV